MADISPVREKRLKEVFFCVDRAGDAGATIQDVAKCLNLKVTPQIREMLDQCVELSWLRKEQSILETGRGARMGWRYFVNPES